MHVHMIRIFPRTGDTVISLIVRTSSSQEIFIGIGCEVGSRACLAAERFAVADLLEVVQTAGDAFVAVGVECIEVDRSSAVNAAVHLGTGEDRIAVRVDNAGCG